MHIHPGNIKLITANLDETIFDKKVKWIRRYILKKPQLSQFNFNQGSASSRDLLRSPVSGVTSRCLKNLH